MPEEIGGFVKGLVFALVGIVIVGGSLVGIGITQLKNTSATIGGTEGAIIGIGTIIMAAGFALSILEAFMK